MIKYFVIILLFLTQLSFAQTQPSGFPTQFNTGWQQWGYQQSTLGTIIARRDTTFLPRFNGTIVFRPQNIRPYFYDSTALRWYKLFSEPDTLTTLATKYDLTQLPQTNPGLPLNSIQFNNSGSFAGDVGLTYNMTINTVTTDSVHAIQHRADFVTLNQIDVIDSLRAFGNSIEFGSSASPISLSYVNRLGSYLEKPVGNYAISSRGMVTTVSQAYIYTPLMNNAITITKIGFNDIRRADIFGVNGYKTTNKIINGHNCLFAAHFLKSFVGAGSASVTRYNVGGSWSAPWDARAEAGKSATGAFTGGNNDSATYVFTDSTVIVGLIGGNTEGSTYDIYVDNILKKTGTTIGQYDGVNDGFTGNTRAPLCAIITGLTYAQHTCKVVKTSGASLLILDYFGHLVNAASAPPLVFLHLPYMDATGYATSPANSSNVKTDTINHKIDSIVATFNQAYPVFRIQTNTCYDTLTGLNLSDHIHPNNTGHLQIFNCITAELNSDSKPMGSLYYSDYKLYFTDTTGPNKVILGGGTTNYIPKYSTENKILNSQIQDDGTNVGINQTPATYKLSITGSLRNTTDAYFATSSGSVGIGTTAPNQKLDVNGHISLTGSLFSKGTLSGINLDSRQSSTSAWSLYADNGALKFFSVAKTLDRVKFWVRGGMTIGYAAESNISDLGSTLDVHGSVRITPDSVQQVSSVTSEKVALLDTITGKIKSIYASILVPSITTLYTGNGTLAGNRTVTANNLNLTFDDVQTFRINYDTYIQSKADGTFPYTNTIVAPAQQLWMGYTPTAGTFSKGSAIVIDTNNNVALGTSTPPTTAPLYADGAAYIHGLQSGRGNFYRVSDFSADHTMTNTEYWANIDASGGNVTITLPAASTVFGSSMGIQYVFKRTDASGNTVTVQRNATPGTDLIDGAASFTIVGQYTVKEVQCLSTSTFGIK